MEKDKKVIAVVSGGMDSAAMLYWLLHARTKPEDILAVSFNYNQRHKRELIFAKDLAAELGIAHTIVDLTDVGAHIASTALIDRRQEVPEGHYAHPSMAATVVPNRNSIMLNIAIGMAVSLKASVVSTGVHAGDHPVYPDCRPDFIHKLQELARVANEGYIDPTFSIYAPWLHKTKADIVKEGDKYGIPWEMTWSCYVGRDAHCGRCSTCVERQEAFDLAKVPDPTWYADDSYWKSQVTKR